MRYSYPQYNRRPAANAAPPASAAPATARGRRQPPAPYDPRRPARVDPRMRAGMPGRAPVIDWKSPWVIFLALTALISVVLLPIFLLGGVYTYYMISGLTFPGVTAGTLPLGDLSQAETVEKLNAQWNQQKTLLATDGARSWPAAPGDLGIQVDAQATAQRALQVGRGDHALQELFWLARFGSITVDPVIVFDPAAARTGLQRLASQVDQPAQNASLRIENGDWAAVPGTNGSALNIDQTLARIAAQPGEVFASGFVPLVMQPVAPRVSDLTPVLDQLRGMLDHPFKLQAYDPITNETMDIKVPRETLAGWITVTPQGDNFAVSMEGQRVSEFLDQWKTSLGPDRTLEDFTPPANLAARWQKGKPVTVIVRHNPTSYTVQPGDTLTSIAFKVGMPYWKIQQSNPNIDPDRLMSGQELTIPSKNDMLPLPVVLNKRIVISISQQHMWVYENGQQRNEYVISTGIDRSPTIPGIYQIRTHDINAYASVWDLYMPHFMGIYEGWPGFMNGIHGLPTLSSGRQLWAGNLGHQVSYGCIILGLQEAEDLYNWAEEGVVVEIQP